MYVIGLTGGIGSGKTAVSNRFKQLGIAIVDADVVSREIVEPGKPALKAIKNFFGPSVMLPDGSLNRAAMRQRVFADRAEKEWLEELLHPLIGSEIDRQLKSAKSPYAILVSPLLLETNQSNLCQRILIVDVSEDTQIERASARDNNDPTLIKSIIATQMKRQQRLSFADDIINNEGSVESLYHQVDTLHDMYVDLATA